MKNRYYITIGFIVAFACSVIINIPLWHALVFTDELLWPDVILQNGDEAFYLARIREVADGHPNMGQPFLFERRDEPYNYGVAGELILGSLMRLKGLSIKTVTILADSVGVFLLVLMAWLALQTVVPDWRWRLLAIAWFFLGASLFIGQRIVSPQLNLIPVFLYLLALFHPRRELPQWCVIRGTLIGTLFYVYPYYWTYCISAEALLILWDLYHEKNWSARIQRILWTSLPLLIIALPWLIGAWQNRGDVLMAETLTRLGLIHTRWPKGPIHQLQAILAIAAIWWLARSKKDVAAAWPLLSFVGAALVVYNQAILTNAELEFSNHYSIISRISVQLAVVWLLMHLPTHYRWLQLSGVLAISALIILQTISWQNDVWNQFTTHAQSPNRSTDRAVMDALNALPTEQVIVTPLTFATDVAIYTPHYPFFSNATRLMPVANDELVMRARIMRQFFPGDKISPRMVVGTHHINLAVHKRIECRVFNLLPGRSVDCDSIKPEQFLSSLWQEFVTAPRFSGTELFSLLREKHVGYLLAENVPASLLSRLELVATIEPYKLYKLKV